MSADDNPDKPSFDELMELAQSQPTASDDDKAIKAMADHLIELAAEELNEPNIIDFTDGRVLPQQPTSNDD